MFVQGASYPVQRESFVIPSELETEPRVPSYSLFSVKKQTTNMISDFVDKL